ncbi:MAG: hypothetical protein M3Q73_00025 [bacterium]|nr:hypothetical protein [bacterium]
MENQLTSTPPEAPRPLQPMLPPAGTLLKESFVFYKKHLGLIVGIAVVPIILSLALILLGDIQVPYVFAIGALILVIISSLSYIALTIAVSKNGVVEGDVVGAYSASVNLLIPNIWMSLISMCAVIGGFVLLFVPGFYLALAISLGIFVLIVENKRGLDALAQSWHYVRGYWGHIFGKLFFFGVAMILISIAVGIVAAIATLPLLGSDQKNDMIFDIVSQILQGLVLGPLGTIYLYLIYQGMRKIKPEPANHIEFEGLKNKLRTVAILGVVAIVAFIALLIKTSDGFNPQFRIPTSGLPSGAGWAELLQIVDFK